MADDSEIDPITGQPIRGGVTGLPGGPQAKPTTPNPWDDPLRDAYKQFTGRSGDQVTAADLASHYGNPGGLVGALSTIKDSDEAKSYAAKPTTTTAPDPYAQFGAYDPKLVGIYKNAKLMPGGQGSGFADIAYWGDKPSQWDRLAADIAGTGPDQPTGTPWGTGLWQNSGAADRAKWGGSTPPPEGRNNGGFWNSGLDTSGITDSPVIRNLILKLMQTTGASGPGAQNG